MSSDFRDRFQELSYVVHNNAKNHGFWDDQNNRLVVPTKLCLVHSEVSEATEAHREGDGNHLCEELADIVIRVMDLACYLRYDLGQKIEDKVAANVGRPPKHGGKVY